MRNFTQIALLAGAAAAQFQQPKHDSDNLVHFQQPYAHHGYHVAHQGDRSDAHRSFEEICEENGFAFEVHEVTTDDGYILNVFRIPGLVSEQVHGSVHYHGGQNVSKPPVLMQHGLFDSAYCWIVNYADIAPAFVAARAGYDVWLGNSRGNTFSRHHIHLDPDHHGKAFWNYSWFDMGKYDLPAMIDLIQNETGGQKVAYVGHSQGTTQMFSALAENPDYYKDKLSLFVALGPVSMVPHSSAAFIGIASHFYDVLADTSDLLGIYEVGGADWFTSGISDLFCVNIAEFCEAILSLFVNQHPEIDDDDRFAVYAGHSPNGTSMKDILHYTQNYKEARFQVFADDYESWFKRHEHRTTDLIPLENITGVPIAMFTGSYDVLADVTDSRWTRDMLHSNIVEYQEIEAGHLTFLVGKDMTYWTHDVMGLLNHYQPLPRATYHHTARHNLLQ